MKHSLSVVILVLTNLAIYSQSLNPNRTFSLTGKIDGKDSGLVYLTYTDSSENAIVDSIELRSGEFSFTGFIIEPTYAYFQTARNDHFNSKSMFIEPTAITATFKINDFENAIISGSHTQDERDELNRQKKKFSAAMKPLNDALRQNIEALRRDTENKQLLRANRQINKKLTPYHAKMDEINLEFVGTHPNSYLSAYFLRGLMVNGYPIDRVNKLFQSFRAEIKKSINGKAIEAAITCLPGNKAKDFAAIDINGKPVSLSSFKGKSYVLLDFWATWCGPCRSNSPHLIKLFNKYHVKGLEIIGIANDDNRVEAWKKAIEQDNTHLFYQVLQGAHTKDDIGVQFGISSIPTKILIDKEGTIIFKHVGNRDKQLDKKLAQIFK